MTGRFLHQGLSGPQNRQDLSHAIKKNDAGRIRLAKERRGQPEISWLKADDFK